MSYMNRSRRSTRYLLIILAIVILALAGLILVRTGVISFGGEQGDATVTADLTEDALKTPGGTQSAVVTTTTAEATIGTALITATVDTPIYNGPGEDNQIVARMSAGQTAEVRGVSRDGLWWQINIPNGQAGLGWVAQSDVIAENIENVPVVDPDLQPTVQVTTTPESSAIVTANTNVNIRSAPDVISEIVGLFETGQVADVLGINFNRSWWYIRIPDTESDRGWVSNDFVTAENADNVPVVDENGNPIGGELPIPTPIPGQPALTALVNLNIRSSPNVGSDLIGLLNQGQSAQVVGQTSDGAWWAINIPSADNGRGWVSADYVTTENVEEVPVIGG